ncbi:hypothetical protein GCM10010363_61310 [Streptomyces omiyaensis]|nr:hypothetical protein GCM10010363_61310 [Streptomyces omiyaensis]
MVVVEGGQDVGEVLVVGGVGQGVVAQGLQAEADGGDGRGDVGAHRWSAFALAMSAASVSQEWCQDWSRQ